mmetsp:Transcript_55925/g.131681  ORF Transcript_55925/g.131681 Transcript_55925/m.131681 type:complete len:264 (+) Transcript_55925:679-1470(+)
MMPVRTKLTCRLLRKKEESLARMTSTNERAPSTGAAAPSTPNHSSQHRKHTLTTRMASFWYSSRPSGGASFTSPFIASCIRSSRESMASAQPFGRCSSACTAAATSGRARVGPTSIAMTFSSWMSTSDAKRCSAATLSSSFIESTRSISVDNNPPPSPSVGVGLPSPRALDGTPTNTFAISDISCGCWSRRPFRGGFWDIRSGSGSKRPRTISMTPTCCTSDPTIRRLRSVWRRKFASRTSSNCAATFPSATLTTLSTKRMAA